MRWRTTRMRRAISRRLRLVPRRKLQLQAGAERRVARRGLGYDYNDKDLRRHEREIVEQQEHAYAVMTAHWQPRGPAALKNTT
ncbi:hypothetical protein ACWDSD_35275 [Streptomyces spiralis]